MCLLYSNLPAVISFFVWFLPETKQKIWVNDKKIIFNEIKNGKLFMLIVAGIAYKYEKSYNILFHKFQVSFYTLIKKL